MSLAQCVTCKKEFDWDLAYKQQHTPGSHLHNPPGHGNFRPRAFCPNCGSLVAEWDIDRYSVRDRWKWYGENAKANGDRSLPPSPLCFWGRSIPPDGQTVVGVDRIDIDLVKQLLGEDQSQQIKEQTQSQIASPEQIFSDANTELDRWLQSRAKYLDRTKHAFQVLQSYVEGKGESDAKAIALLGIIEYFDGKREPAKEMFERAMKLDELCALCHLGLGILDYWEDNAAQRGVERLSRAIALDPTLVDAYVWKARIQKQKLKDPESAWNSLQNSVSVIGENRLKEHPRGDALFLELGLSCIYDGKGGVDDAVRYFETALQMNPSNYTAPMYLMHIYRVLSRPVDVARTQAAYEKADQGVGLSNSAIDSIRTFIAQSSRRASQREQGPASATEKAKPISTARPKESQRAIKRPRSVTVIGWIIIACALIPLLLVYIVGAGKVNTRLFLGIVRFAILLISGIGVLRGENRARYLFVFGPSSIFLLETICYWESMKPVVSGGYIGYIAWTAIIAFILFRRNSNNYFRMQPVHLPGKPKVTPTSVSKASTIKEKTKKKVCRSCGREVLDEITACPCNSNSLTIKSD